MGRGGKFMTGMTTPETRTERRSSGGKNN